MEMSNFKYLLMLFSMIGFSQVEPPSTALKNLAPPNSPAFVLMDITPSNIIIPESTQAFSIQTLNAFSGNNEGLSNNNYAIEFQPYWYVKRENMNFFRYNNLTTTKLKGGVLEINDYDGYNIFGDIWKKASISLALMSGNFEVFEESQSYISVGIRTRLISIRTEKQIDDIKDQYIEYDQFIKSDDVIMIQGNARLTPEEKKNAIVKLLAYQKIVTDFETIVKRKPLFSLDVALAYSHFMGNRNQGYDDGFGRFGVWTSADLALYTPSISKDSYIHFYGVFRYLRDGLNLDENNILYTENKLDYGGKVELEFNKLSFAYEYITRDGENDNESRSIASVRYKINEAFTLNGGFGENFMSEGNSVVLFGIQWGLSNGNSVSLNTN